MFIIEIFYYRIRVHFSGFLITLSRCVLGIRVYLDFDITIDPHPCMFIVVNKKGVYIGYDRRAWMHGVR